MALVGDVERPIYLHTVDVGDKQACRIRYRHLLGLHPSDPLVLQHGSRPYVEIKTSADDVMPRLKLISRFQPQCCFASIL